jgi:hypothetical protein
MGSKSSTARICRYVLKNAYHMLSGVYQTPRHVACFPLLGFSRASCCSLRDLLGAPGPRSGLLALLHNDLGRKVYEQIRENDDNSISARPTPSAEQLYEHYEKTKPKSVSAQPTFTTPWAEKCTTTTRTLCHINLRTALLHTALGRTVHNNYEKTMPHRSPHGPPSHRPWPTMCTKTTRKRG